MDISAWSSASSLHLRTSRRLDGGLRFAAELGYFDEERGNGTRLTGSAVRGTDVVITLQPDSTTGERPEWRFLAFAQTRRLMSFFSSVSPDRTFETPSLDQFKVPASSLGLAFELGKRFSDFFRLDSGLDARWIEGETNERFRWRDGRFTGLREAGGRQILAGGFFRGVMRSGAFRHEFGLRGDYWRNDRSKRIEKPLSSSSGFPLQTRLAPGASGLIPSLRYDANWLVVKPLTLSASVYVGGRVPTLNELHRPFRVRDDITESNPALSPEQLRGIDFGGELRASANLRVSSRAFYNELHDGVANVTLGLGPFESESFGSVPLGVTLRQKRNLPRIDILGVESAVEYALAPSARLIVRHLFTDGRVGDAGTYSSLSGKRPAQAAAHQMTASLHITPHPSWEIELQGRGASSQFEDDLNHRRLAGFAVADLRVSWSPRAGTEFFAACENLFDFEIETGKADAGLLAVSGHRSLRCGVSLRF